MKSLLSGVVIFTDRPFEIGDWVEIGVYQGTVKDITFRSTRIQTITNAIVTIPNSLITAESVTNWNKLKTRRVGAANYQVPVEVSPERRITLGLRWLVNYSRLRNEKTMIDRLAGEILDAANGTGASVKKREDTHRMAEANKAFAHYKW